MADRQPIFTRKQGTGLLLFLAFVLVLRLFIHFLPAPETTETSVSDTLATVFVRLDTVVLRPFDPNTADSLTHYREKGGRFRKPDDFRRLYGLTDSAFQVLRPYIAIDTMPFFAERQERLLRDSLRRDSIQRRYNERRDSIERAYQERRDSLLKAGVIHLKKDTVIELNTADTGDLQYIRGIGSYTARQIVRYRDLLGGYSHPGQLREIERLDYMKWDSVMPHLTADTALIRRINVQTAPMERLTRHPYISFTQAKAVYETRRRKIRLTGMEDLCPSVFTQEEAARIRPYLDFTPPPKGGGRQEER